MKTENKKNHNVDSEIQKELYEKIHEEYESHYYDADSMAYRERFMYGNLFNGLNLNDCDVAELAPGSGYNTLEIQKRFPKARITGYDISEKACKDYRKKTGCEAFQIDLTKEYSGKKNFYDFAIIIGGLHHCIADLPTTLKNIHSMLKLNGWLIMAEPNKKFFLQGLRNIWYKVDKRYFDPSTEAALDHDELVKLSDDIFSVHDIQFIGGPGFILIYNSMAFRMPKKLKHVIAPPLFSIDSLYNRLSSSYWFPFFLARWQAK